MSPVKCKLMSSIGAICTFPPPVAPPLIPNTGPNDGSLKAKIEFFPMVLNPSATAMDMVVFPSPTGVGFTAVTKISFPFLRPPILVLLFLLCLLCCLIWYFLRFRYLSFLIPPFLYFILLNFFMLFLVHRHHRFLHAF